MAEINYLDFWAKGNDGRYYHIMEGTGDNLLSEDIADGYIDYIYYEIYDGLQAIYENDEYDGGQVLLRRYYQDMTLGEIVAEVMAMESVSLAVIE